MHGILQRIKNTLPPINLERMENWEQRERTAGNTHTHSTQAVCFASHTCFIFVLGFASIATILMRDKPAKLHPNSPYKIIREFSFANILSVFIPFGWYVRGVDNWLWSMAVTAASNSRSTLETLSRSLIVIVSVWRWVSMKRCRIQFFVHVILSWPFVFSYTHTLHWKVAHRVWPQNGRCANIKISVNIYCLCEEIKVKEKEKETKQIKFN